MGKLVKCSYCKQQIFAFNIKETSKNNLHNFAKDRRLQITAFQLSIAVKFGLTKQVK